MSAGCADFHSVETSGKEVPSLLRDCIALFGNHHPWKARAAEI